jgi:hypothetical protein
MPRSKSKRKTGSAVGSSEMVRRLALRSTEAQIGNLYEAVAQYIEKNGGSVIVIGGIEIQQWPHDPMGKFRVAVSLLGKIPERLRSPNDLSSTTAND